MKVQTCVYSNTAETYLIMPFHFVIRITTDYLMYFVLNVCIKRFLMQIRSYETMP